MQLTQASEEKGPADPDQTQQAALHCQPRDCTGHCPPPIHTASQPSKAAFQSCWDQNPTPGGRSEDGCCRGDSWGNRGRPSREGWGRGSGHSEERGPAVGEGKGEASVTTACPPAKLTLGRGHQALCTMNRQQINWHLSRHKGS